MSDTRMPARWKCRCGESNSYAQEHCPACSTRQIDCAPLPVRAGEPGEFHMEYIDADHIRLTPLAAAPSEPPTVPTREERCPICGEPAIVTTQTRPMSWGPRKPVNVTYPAFRCTDHATCGEIWLTVAQADHANRELWKATIAEQDAELTAMRATVARLSGPVTDEEASALLKNDERVKAALYPFLFAEKGSPLGEVNAGLLRELSLASFHAARRAEHGGDATP